MKEKSVLMTLFRSADPKRVQQDEESFETDIQDRTSWREAFVSSKRERRSGIEDEVKDNGKDNDKEDDFEKALSNEDAEQEREDAAKLAQLRDDHVKKTYANFVSVEEEVDLLLKDTKVFLDSYAAHSVQSSVVAMEARAKAVQKALGVGSDGKAAPMSVLDWLWYGTNRNKLEKMLEYARRRYAAIEGELDSMADAETKFADAVLVQHFVLEQFSAYKRYVLKRKFFSYPMCSVPVISASAWVISWLVLAGMQIFFFYYVLAWGLRNGDSAFKAWCLNFLVGFVMEFLVIQTVEIYGKEVFLWAVSTPCFDDVSISMNVSFIFTYHSPYIHSSHQHPGHVLHQAAIGLHLPHLAEGGYRQRAKPSVG